jgi:hypothetical protein
MTVTEYLGRLRIEIVTPVGGAALTRHLLRLLNQKHPELNLTAADANLIKEHTGTHIDVIVSCLVLCRIVCSVVSCVVFCVVCGS